MKKELEHYTVGESYGGSQDWFSELWMNRGGCGAVTACDVCIDLARSHGMRWLYPFDPRRITREDFLAFGRRMRPYLSPRRHGIDKTSIFIDGFRDYLAACGGTLRMDSVEGTEPFEAARAAVRDRIDAGVPVPYLMLLHRDRELEDYNWHWFLLNGYEERPDGFFVKAVTYGAWRWLDLARLWDTGHDEKGGLVRIFCRPPGRCET